MRPPGRPKDELRSTKHEGTPVTAEPTFVWKREPIPDPGDDVVPVPPPVTEEPPHDRFCDLVLTGGVASGVVYPWAIVELARAYRFRNIGGTSVGAMAAALAAAAEYGRRTGFETPFEALRRSPASLARIQPDGRTRMLSLFQPNPRGKRLMELWGRLANGDQGGSPCPSGGITRRALVQLMRIFSRPAIIGALLGAALALAASALALDRPLAGWGWLTIGLVLTLTLLFAAIGGLLALVFAVLSDFRHGVIANDYGLCKGATLDSPGSALGPSGITEWLHVGIQRGAGLKKTDRPLTFGDLWTAPAHPGGERVPCGPADPPGNRSINLQVITTNVTHGRPYRLPMADETSRLFFKPEELADYFPEPVLRALVDASLPYAPKLARGEHQQAEPPAEPPADHPTARDLYELPAAGLPLVVAARLSLSFPPLFAAMPLWAIDYEAPRGQRTLRRCIFTDGGVSSNFPIHLFDAAVPRWPTFGLWLDRRTPYWREDRDVKGQAAEEEVCLPRFNAQGGGDSWDRFDPGSRPIPEFAPDAKCPCPASGPRWLQPWSDMAGFLIGIVSSAKDWQDRTTFRLPQVRNRVARLLLLPGEGGLHIGMPREQILRMAYRYGTQTGQKFVERFKDQDGRPSQAWKEQRWVRFNLLVDGLRESLDGLATSAASSARTDPIRHAIAEASNLPGPVLDRGDCHRIDPGLGRSLADLLSELERLEATLKATPSAFDALPKPELRLRPPL